MRTLYNEGRVVGLSAYEIYVRQVLSVDPDAEILSEREWLAATLSANNSMILKIKAGTTRGYHDYLLPAGSDLCSCTWIIGSIFEGDVTCDANDEWAIKVDDYGRLISNTALRHPVTPGYPSDVPVKADYIHPSEEYANQCKEYMKISAGLMLQPGEWTSNVYQVPLTNETDVELTTENDEVLLADLCDERARMRYKANLAERGFARILIMQDIEHDFYILLRGFSHKSLVISLFGDVNDSLHPQNGDFLGPELFPWANPISFVYTNDMMSTFTAAIQDMSEEVNRLNVTVQILANGQIDISSEAMAALEDARRAAEEANAATQRVRVLADMLERTQAQAYDLQNSVSDLSSDVSGLSDNVDAISGNVDTLSGQVDTISGNVDTLSGQVDTISGDIDTISGNIDTISGNVSDLSDDVANIEASTGDVAQAITAINNKIGNMNNLDTTNKSTLVSAINETLGETEYALLSQ